MNNFDTQLNKLLQETYFGGSPNEQATGIKRHVTFEQDQPTTEFGETAQRKKAAIDAATDIAVDAYNNDEEMRTNKKAFSNFVIKTLADVEERIEGDEYTLSDIKTYFDEVGRRTTGKPPMSAERYRNILQQALLKLRKLLGAGLNQNTDPDVETDPDKLDQARRGLEAGLQMARRRKPVMFEDIADDVVLDDDESDEESEDFENSEQF